MLASVNLRVSSGYLLDLGARWQCHDHASSQVVRVPFATPAVHIFQNLVELFSTVLKVSKFLD